MQINHNIRAMVTQHALYQNNGSLSKSLEKLSTGLRINRAQDDAAGLAMSEQMRTQLRGLAKSKQNSQDGIAALQIAEGGLQEITNILQRQRELAVQSANDTLTTTERKYLDDEFQELSKEIGRIALTTDYNGKNLLANGSVMATGANGAQVERTLNMNNSFGVVDAKEKDATGAANSNYLKAQSFTLHVGPNYGTNVGGALSNQTPITYHGINFTKLEDTNASKADQLKNFTMGIYAQTSSWSGSINFATLSITGIKGTGANATVDTRGIYKTIDALDGAVKSINATRAKIGTFINRMEYTVNNIANLEFNTQDAESRIRDTDFAKETTNFTRNQIMVQSATSMLAQANSLPQSVLGLLG